MTVRLSWIRASAVLMCAPFVQLAAAFVNKGSDIVRDWIQALVVQCVCPQKPGSLQCCWLHFVTSSEVASLEDRLWHMWYDRQGDCLCRVRGDVRATKQCLVSVCLSQAQLGPRCFPLQGVFHMRAKHVRTTDRQVQPARTTDVNHISI